MNACCWLVFQRIFLAATILICLVDQHPFSPTVSTTYTTSSGQSINTKRVLRNFLSGFRPSPNFVHRCHAAVPKPHHLALHGRRGADIPQPKGSVRKASTYPGKGSRRLPTCPVPMAPHERIRRYQPESQRRVVDRDGIVILTMKLCTGTCGDDCKTRTTH